MLTKKALIVANRDYDDPSFPPLPAAIADAKALARVLEDPEIGAFDVEVMEDGTTSEIKRAVEALFSKAGRNDQLLLHLSCHGIRHVNNRLFFITRTTERDFPASTAIEADFVNDQMEQSRSAHIILLLDCCYSGAFTRGFRPRAGSSESVSVDSSFSGKGHIILTASTALQFSYERDAHKILNVDVVQPALFTGAIVRGLETGEADNDEDGQISVNELYDYVYAQVTAVAPGQTPTMSGDRAQGTLYIARSPRGARASGPLLSRLTFERRIDEESGFSFPVPIGWKEEGRERAASK